MRKTVCLNKFSKNKADDESTISFVRLFRFATPFEYFMMLIGVVFTALKSFGMSLIVMVYGEFTSLFVDRIYQNGTSSNTTFLHLFGGGRVLTNATTEENRLAIIEDSISCGILMAIVSVYYFMMSIFCVDLFNYTALYKTGNKNSNNYFCSMIRQEIGWFDCASSDSNMAVRISEDIEKIRDAIAEKFSHFLSLIFGFVLYVAISFHYGWELTLVTISYVPVLSIVNLIASRLQTTLSAKESNAYATASHLSEEVFGGIRTVVSFCGEKKESERYEKLLEPVRKLRNLFNIIAKAQKFGIRNGLASGICSGIMRFLLFGMSSLAYWYGVPLVQADRDKVEREYTVAVLMIIMVNMSIASENICCTAPFLDCFNEARGAAVSIFKVIDRKSKIDSMFDDGKMITHGVKGDIEFEDVGFHYPSRANAQILNHLSVKFTSGQTVALVGSSANGKSTCIQLLQRFYDPTSGRVLIDGHDIKHFNISWLRSKIAYVGQEPILFATTIEENIRFGKPDATRMEIEASAKMSGAHDFIVKLQDGYQTLVGERGSQLSGGQKQRIAISRALIQNPIIFLLDEATSALDTDTERLVQDALNKASKGRTTIVVSHRLSAIRNADRILFIEKGKIVEDGTHDEIVELQGSYYNMMRSNNMDNDNITKNTDHNDDENLPNTKLVEKQMFADSTRTQNHQNDAATDYVAEKEQKELIKYGDVLKRILLMARHCMHMARVFDTMIRQDMAWFDDSDNSVGALPVGLNSDASNVQGAIGFPLSGIIQSIAGFLFSFCGAFALVSKLALVTIVTAPLVIIFVILEGKQTASTEDVERKGIEEIAKIATESTSNIRTVASLRQEPHIVARFCNELAKLEKTIRKRLLVRGLIYSSGLAIPYFGYAIGLYYGGLLVANEGVKLEDIVKVCEALLYGSVVMAQALAFAPAFTAAFVAGHRLFQVLDRETKIESPEIYDLNRKPDKGSNVKFKQIDFNYPTRPSLQILQNMNLDVPEGKTVALVGPSGCGKSTCIQLLQRLYDPHNGHIHLGQDEISRDITLTDLRSKLSIVSQEPILFDRSIAENIAYGDNSRVVDMVDIIEAAKTANIHDFIVSLPMGYETKLGSKTTQLSGGQKQRVSIVRALVRNPKVLLLDEATSALDIASEKIVQSALDVARSGRTCLVIAHRLSTIQNADLICVIRNGAVCEQGTHNQLMALGGLYSKLYSMQPSVE